jgi:uncharacterized membrane protein HdeD (DUF308 family)
MKSKQWEWVILLGVLSFLVGATVIIFGYLGTSAKYAFPALGLILIGVGVSGKRRAS